MLHFSNVSIKDAGIYNCKATNKLGSHISKPGSLKLLGKPSLSFVYKIQILNFQLSMIIY